MFKLRFDKDSGYVTTDANITLPDIYDDCHTQLLGTDAENVKTMISDCIYWHPCAFLYKIGQIGMLEFIQSLTQIVDYYQSHQQLFSIVMNVKKFNKKIKYEEQQRGLDVINFTCDCFRHATGCINYNCHQPYWIRVNEHMISKGILKPLPRKVIDYVYSNNQLFKTTSYKLTIDDKLYVHSVCFVLLLLKFDLPMFACVLDLVLIRMVGNYNYLRNC